MGENTDKAFAELIGKLQSLINGAEGQLPDIANQMLVYGAFSAKMFIGAAVILMLFAIILGFKGIFDYDSPGCGIIGAIFFVISLLMLTDGMKDVYKISHAPKLYLLDKAASYIGRNR